MALNDKIKGRIIITSVMAGITGLYGGALYYGDKSNDTAFLEGKVIDESMPNTNQISQYDLTVQTTDGLIYSIYVVDCRNKPNSILSDRIEIGTTVRFPTDYKLHIPGDSPYFSRDRIGRLSGCKIELLDK